MNLPRRITVSERPAKKARKTTARDPLSLTRRERTVLNMLYAPELTVAEAYRRLHAPLTNEEIASRLYISVHTARHHVEAVLRKLNVSSREAVASAVGIETKQHPQSITEYSVSVTSELTELRVLAAELQQHIDVAIVKLNVSGKESGSRK